MLQSLAIILLLGLVFSKILEKFKIPGLIGMIIVGICISKFMHPKIFNISSDLRQIALIVILTRSGLSLNLDNLKKVGRPAMLLCFLPATFEMIACSIIAPMIFKISHLEGALLGSVLAAVSPAVVSPRMIRMIENKIGIKKGIPEMILAGASVDDVYVIVFFTSFLTLLYKNTLSYMEFVKLPISIVLGIVFGIILGKIILYIYNKIEMSSVNMTITLISISFLAIKIQDFLPIAVLLSLMVMGMTINRSKDICQKLNTSYMNLWKVFEILLFVLVGVSIKVEYLKENFILGILLILLILIFRMLAVYICVLRTNLNTKERVFCMLAYIPKATVQAAIGGVPLAMGLNCGSLVLTISAIAILFTAPIGAYLIDNTQQYIV